VSNLNKRGDGGERGARGGVVERQQQGTQVRVPGMQLPRDPGREAAAKGISVGRETHIEPRLWWPLGGRLSCCSVSYRKGGEP